MKSPYDILGVDRDADETTLKKVYRKLAKDYHPDRNPNDKKMAERFKEVSAAYAFLSDKNMRGRYDRGEIDEDGQPTARAYARGHGGDPGGDPGSNRTGGGFSDRRSGAFSDFDMDDAEGLFSEFFKFTRGNARGRSGASTERASASTSRNQSSRIKNRGLDISYNITVGFEESLNGSKREVVLNDGRRINVTIPEGIQSGQVIRLAGQGGEGLGGGENGDALIEIDVAPHPYFTRDGLDILLDLPISLDEAVLGGDLEVPTPSGRITVRVPPNSSSGRRLRLKGKGVKRRGDVGHMYVSLKLVLPPKPDPKLEEAVKSWGQSYGKKLRSDAGF